MLLKILIWAYTFPCIDAHTVDANWIPTPIPTTLKRVEIASPLANRSLRFPSLANEEYIGNLVALDATTAIPCKTNGKVSLYPKWNSLMNITFTGTKKVLYPDKHKHEWEWTSILSTCMLTNATM